MCDRMRSNMGAEGERVQEYCNYIIRTTEDFGAKTP
jgi:hypothetical protein